ncbi:MULTISPECIES: hypothetical protein [Pseudomonadota]|uniref:hypothetical protein n=1 Tax=Pseudomonadota TaxID=1224 RepID=UPI00261B55C3|nr:MULTISPECIES: hypothetical protein [Pseudomonadota]
MDTIITAAGLAAFTVAGFMFLLTKLIGWKGVAKHKAKVDIGCSFAAFFLFAGTSTLGIFVAVMSGFIASVATSIIGKVVNPESKPLTPQERAAQLRSNLDRIRTAPQGWKAEANPSTRH